MPFADSWIMSLHQAFSSMLAVREIVECRLSRRSALNVATIATKSCRSLGCHLPGSCGQSMQSARQSIRQRRKKIAAEKRVFLKEAIAPLRYNGQFDLHWSRASACFVSAAPFVFLRI